MTKPFLSSVMDLSVNSRCGKEVEDALSCRFEPVKQGLRGLVP